MRSTVKFFKNDWGHSSGFGQMSIRDYDTIIASGLNRNLNINNKGSLGRTNRFKREHFLGGDKGVRGDDGVMEKYSQDSEDYPCDCVPEMIGDFWKVGEGALGDLGRELGRRVEHVEAKLKYTLGRWEKVKARVVADLESISGKIRGVLDSESEV
jgi:hypothetical protein